MGPIRFFPPFFRLWYTSSMQQAQNGPVWGIVEDRLGQDSTCRFYCSSYYCKYSTPARSAQEH